MHYIGMACVHKMGIPSKTNSMQLPLGSLSHLTKLQGKKQCVIFGLCSLVVGQDLVHKLLPAVYEGPSGQEEAKHLQAPEGSSIKGWISSRMAAAQQNPPLHWPLWSAQYGESCTLLGPADSMCSEHAECSLQGRTLAEQHGLPSCERLLPEADKLHVQVRQKTRAHPQPKRIVCAIQ